MILRDKFWLWGHPEGRYNNMFGNDRVSRMTPMEACAYLGIRNVFMVPVGTDLNERQYNKSFRNLNGVGWGYCFFCKKYWKFDSVIDTIFENARNFPNINCVAFDDYKLEGIYKTVPTDEIQKVIDRLHNEGPRRLDCWMTLYIREFGDSSDEDEDFQKHIDLMDGIVMWNWCESDYESIPKKFEIFKKITAKKRRMCGCYLYNFGESKPASPEAVKWQLDWYREKILSGEIEGVVLHTNTMADVDYEAYDVACDWLDKHGDEIVSD